MGYRLKIKQEAPSRSIQELLATSIVYAYFSCIFVPLLRLKCPQTGGEMYLYLGLRIVASMCSVSGCLQSHTPAREQLAVLSDGFLRHTATGVLTRVIHRRAKRRTIQRSIVPLKTSNDPVVYGAPLPDAGEHHTRTHMHTHRHTHKALERRPLAGNAGRNAAGSSSSAGQEA